MINNALMNVIGWGSDARDGRCGWQPAGGSVPRTRARGSAPAVGPTPPHCTQPDYRYQFQTFY